MQHCREIINCALVVDSCKTKELPADDFSPEPAEDVATDAADAT